MVMDGHYKRKVQFKPAPDAKSFVCGLCVARRDAFARKTPEDPQFCLKTYRKDMKLTQAALAMKLGIDRSMISKVESGEKLMPREWIGMLSDLKNVTKTMNHTNPLKM
jgi:DNA-binding XRE family transcriptional regulator